MQIRSYMHVTSCNCMSPNQMIRQPYELPVGGPQGRKHGNVRHRSRANAIGYKPLWDVEPTRIQMSLKEKDNIELYRTTICSTHLTAQHISSHSAKVLVDAVAEEAHRQAQHAKDRYPWMTQACSVTRHAGGLIIRTFPRTHL